MAVSIIVNIVEIIKFYVIYRLGFEVKPTKYLWITSGLFAVAMSIHITYFQEMCNPLFTYLLGIFLVTLIGFEFPKIKGMVIGCWSTCVISILDVLEQQCIQLLFTKYEMLSENIWEIIISSITITILSLFLKGIYKKYHRGIQDTSFGYYLFFLFMGMIYGIIMGFIKMFLSDRRTLCNVLTLSVGMITLLQMFLLLSLAVADKVNCEQIQVNHKYLERQEKYYQYLEKREKKTREFRHDIKKHMYILSEYAKQSDGLEMQTYIEEMFGVINPSESYVTIGNGVADAILNHYADWCNTEGIGLMVEGRMPLECHLHAFDICTIFSNAMQNAVEAAMQTRDKWIHLVVRYSDEILYMQIENSCKNVLKEKHGVLQTTKKDTYNHGYGFSNMKESIAKYGGTVEYSNKENVFSLLLTIPNRRK